MVLSNNCDHWVCGISHTLVTHTFIYKETHVNIICDGQNDPHFLVMVRSRFFNWKGIQENPDGSFTTKGLPEKRRLLKSLHTQGYRVRSRKNPDGTFSVYAVGIMAAKRARAPVMRVRTARTQESSMETPKRAYAPMRGRYVRIGGRPVKYRSLAPRYPISAQYPRPARMFPTRGQVTPARPTFYQKMAYRREQREKKELEWKKSEQEISEKMRKDRELAERQEAVRQIRKDELHAEYVQHERRMQAERLRGAASQPRQEQITGQATIPQRQKEQKIDRVELQAQREEQVI